METILIIDRLEKLLVSEKEVLTFDETCDYKGNLTRFKPVL